MRHETTVEGAGGAGTRQCACGWRTWNLQYRSDAVAAEKRHKELVK